MRALLLGVRTYLREQLGEDSHKYVMVRKTGKPPNFAGERFFAVHGGSIRASQINSLTAEYEVHVTITFKTQGRAPDDRDEKVLVEDEAGMYYWTERVISLLHVQYPPMDRANVLLDKSRNGPGTGLFTEPLKFRSMGPPLEVSGDWVGAEATGIAAYTISMLFGGAKRAQNIDGQA